MVLRGGRLEHRVFRDFPEYLGAGDVLVLNETRVIAARLRGTRLPSGGNVEVLLLRPAEGNRYDSHATRWKALLKPAKRLRVGSVIAFGKHGSAKVTGVDDDGVRELQFELRDSFEAFLRKAGTLALPPYIRNDSAQAQKRYQTIFAAHPGSVAAPTASLHFTKRVLSELERKHVQIVKLTLDIGLGTFRPMKGARVHDHFMHGETYAIPARAAQAIRKAKAQGRRVVAAGTTVVRALEGCALQHGRVRAGADETELFITPGFSFRVVDALLTNFHLPRSTLLVLVSAFAGREHILRSYACAVRERYRFFSFGDAMYIEP